MAPRLSESFQIRRLAADLGLKGPADPVSAVRQFCRERLMGFMAEIPCSTLVDLLALAQDRLGTVFVEVYSSDDLRQVMQKYVDRRELGFARLDQELEGDVLAITIRLLRPQPWERPFVSIIDCRGAKARRAYYSKWHELAHLLTLTNQQRLVFRRTHVSGQENDPEERLMEQIAGDGAFMPEVIVPHATQPVSFDVIEQLRDRLCPEASDQATRIGFVQAWPTPCLLLQGALAVRKGEQRTLDQTAFQFANPPEAALRAVEITANPTARGVNFLIPRNMRIPQESAIYSTYLDGADREAVEDLDWWSSSNGRRLGSQPIRVVARSIYDGVLALVTPHRYQGT